MPGIDLRINAADLANTFEHMRIWLDHEDCIPVNLTYGQFNPAASCTLAAFL